MIEHKTWGHESLQLRVKLGSAIIHAQEFLSEGGHPFDKLAFDNMVADYEVKEWLYEGTKLALLPLKRDDGKPGKEKEPS